MLIFDDTEKLQREDGNLMIKKHEMYVVLSITGQFSYIFLSFSCNWISGRIIKVEALHCARHSFRQSLSPSHYTHYVIKVSSCQRQKDDQYISEEVLEGLR
jgi:hypothetical protein